MYEPSRAFWIASQVEFRHDAGSGLCSGPYDRRLDIPFDVVYPLRYSRGVIEDLVHSKVGSPFRRRNSVGKLPLAVKPVHHSRVSMSGFKDSNQIALPNPGDLTIVQNRDSSDSLCLQEVTRTQCMPPMAWLCARFGVDYVKENILDAIPSTNLDVTFANVEWADLMDKFDEQCKSLIPANFFAGETFAEGGIFLDAIRLVTNPTRAITGFIKNVRKRGLHRMRLGELNRYYKKLFSNKTFLYTEEAIETANDIGFARHLFKEAISLHLGFNFGVVPAIHDVRSTIASHSKVEDRLRFLNTHRGQYAPIRVKKTVPADFTPGSVTSPFLDFHHLLKEAYTVATLFGQGRIRTDINEASRWRAYAEYFGLNKVVGTAWELIPFSFVVDWFTNSQEAINKLTRIPLGESPFMNMTSIGHSIKNTGVYSFICNAGYDLVEEFPNMEPDSQFPIFSYTVSDYTRFPGFPDTSLFADLSNFGSFQGTTGGELLLQKLL